MDKLKKYANADTIRTLIERIGALRQSIIEANDKLAGDIQTKLDEIQRVLEALQAEDTAIKAEQTQIKSDIVEINNILDLIQEEIFNPEGESLIDEIIKQLNALELKFKQYVTIAKHDEDLAKKSDVGHKHTTDEILGLQTTLDDLVKKINAANVAIQNLQAENTTLKAKVQEIETAIAQEVTPTDIENSIKN